MRLLDQPWLRDEAIWREVYQGPGEPLGVRFRAAFASVPRRLAAQAASLSGPSEPTWNSRPHWTLVDWTRLAMIRRAFEAVPDAEQPATLLALFDAGEIGEQVSVLRTLCALPEPARFAETGIHACRTNAKSVFEAIVCENPVPAQYFPELNFNQAVLKAVFMDVSVRRIERLDGRITPELQRMSAGYASERRAAGRSVPTDIDYIVAYGVSP